MELEAILASLEDEEYETGEHDAVPLARRGARGTPTPTPSTTPGG